MPQLHARLARKTVESTLAFLNCVCPVPAAGASAHIALAAASLKQHFELTEVVEQTGGQRRPGSRATPCAAACRANRSRAVPGGTAPGRDSPQGLALPLRPSLDARREPVQCSPPLPHGFQRQPSQAQRLAEEWQPVT